VNEEEIFLGFIDKFEKFIKEFICKMREKLKIKRGS